jgi:hypothetical protein
MEVVNIPKIQTAKADQPQKMAVVAKARLAAYGKTAATSDQVQVSDKGKLLLSLRESMKQVDMPAGADKLQALREKLDQGQKLNAEEIVSGILHGTLFEVL